jgi:argininosuccinate synthase
VRFELGAYALNPDIKVIAPWREWDLTSRTKLIELRRAAPDPDRQGQARRSAVFGRREPAAHLVRGQGAGRPLAEEAPDYVYQRTVHPEDAPDTPDGRDHLREGRRGGDQRRGHVPATILTGSTSWAASTASAGSTSSRTASSA